MSREGWKSPENGRKFFDGFAASKNSTHWMLKSGIQSLVMK